MGIEPVSVKFSADDDLVNSTSGGLAGKSEVLNEFKISSISTNKLGVLILKIKSIPNDQLERLKSSEVGPISAAEEEELKSSKVVPISAAEEKELKSSEVGPISAAEEEEELRSFKVGAISAAEEEFIRKNEELKELRSNKGIIGIAFIWGIWYICIYI